MKRSTRTWPGAVGATLILAACATPEQLAKQDDAFCTSLGLNFGTPEYAQCRIAVATDRSQRQQAVSQGLMSLGGAMMLQNQQQYQSPTYTPAPSLQTNCTGYWVGDVWYTTCR